MSDTSNISGTGTENSLPPRQKGLDDNDSWLDEEHLAERAVERQQHRDYVVYFTK